MECAKGILEIMNPGGVHYDGEVADACPVCGDAKRVYRRIVLGDVSSSHARMRAGARSRPRSFPGAGKRSAGPQSSRGGRTAAPR